MKRINNFARKFAKNKKEWITLILAVGIFTVGLTLIWVSTLKIPTLDSFEERRVTESTKIYDRTGEVLLYDVNQDIRRTVVPFEDISRNIKNATIAIEDQEFYEHNGVKPTAFLRAVLVNLATLEFSQGGSTITQQVVKNSLLTTDKLISRKIKEWVLAIKLEKMIEKDDILNIYLNEIPYGGNIYGIEEATQAFFGKSASDVTIAEAAYLASLPQAPTFYSPYGKNKDRLEARKNLVLAEMLENNFITEEEYESAKNEVVEFKPRPETGIKAPHFVFYVIDYLTEKYGEDEVMNGGLRVVTTLDYELQEAGQEIALRYALDNKEKFNAENASMVAVDPKTGQILVMIGSRDYFDDEIDGNFNIATANRQPGSTFKPFVYSQAFIEGYTPQTVLFDLKTQFTAHCEPTNLTTSGDCYAPDNYDLAFRGPMTMKDSLAQSVNITSVKTLYLAGVQDSIRLARKMGISTLEDSSRYGLTLVLGGGEVSLLDMTSAYSVFANEGVRNPYTAILEVQDRDGEVIESFKQDPEEVLARNVALQISDILSDNVARAPAFGQTSALHFPNVDVAVKTGTTNDYRDAWIIGYTPSITLGAWAGNNDNSPMEKRVAGFIVAPMWREFMDRILEKYPREYFPEAFVDNSYDLKPILRGSWRGGESYLIDKISGKRATDRTPRELIEEVVTGDVHSILYWVDKDNPRGPVPSNPGSDPQFEAWEYSVSAWARANGIIGGSSIRPPEEFDDAHTDENAPEVAIASPGNNSSFAEDEKINVIIESQGKYGVSKIEYYIDNAFIGKVESNPFIFSFTPSDFDLDDGRHTLRAVVYDTVLNKGEDTIRFEIN